MSRLKYGALRLFLLPFAILIDLCLTAAVTFLDFLTVPAGVVTSDGMVLRPTREVRFLQNGVHRLGQPEDDDDDEDDEDEDDGQPGEDDSIRCMNC